MIPLECPYCNKLNEVEPTGFAPAVSDNICIHCKKDYRVENMPLKPLKAMTLEDFKRKYETWT